MVESPVASVEALNAISVTSKPKEAEQHSAWPLSFYIHHATFTAMEQGTLYIVATPIGNLEDITLRALRILKEVDIVYAEDTRVSKKLLERYEIDTPLKRLDAHTEAKKAHEVVDALAEGQQVALISDAGTPGVNDPGSRLVAAVRQALGDSFPIVPIPGPSAFTAALSVSGVPADQFLFLGFLPHKKGRQTLLREIAEEKRTVVLYESPHRISKLLGELSEHIGEREVVVARELTKQYEDVQIGAAADIAEYLQEWRKEKGEFVVIISPQRVHT